MSFRSRYDDVTRAFRQAPWRVQTQLIATFAALAVVIVALGGMYLAEASRTATAGRDVQSLQLQKAELEMSINRLNASIAQMKSVSRLETRVRELGYVPAQSSQVEFIIVDGYRKGQAQAAFVKSAPEETPDYNETLGTWLARALSTMIGLGG
ncbi:MAG: hypothetical protein HZC38_07005 [Chloroflexi bacterium]|nr:hypothetical protein [Chloroflexota bacterium]MBI5080115.1 hypothetical protein [Chloroflexota bacterium]MBI5713156.1 hypothetical protein [Chloroflexota bacterium]